MNRDVSFKAKQVRIEPKSPWELNIEADEVELSDILEHFTVVDVLSEMSKDDILDYFSEDDLVSRLEALGYTVNKE